MHTVRQDLEEAGEIGLRQAPKAWVYAIGPVGGGLTKIGMAGDVARRLAAEPLRDPQLRFLAPVAVIETTPRRGRRPRPRVRASAHRLVSRALHPPIGSLGQRQAASAVGTSTVVSIVTTRRLQKTRAPPVRATVGRSAEQAPHPSCLPLAP